MFRFNKKTAVTLIYFFIFLLSMIPNHLICKDPGRLNVLFICIDDINNWVGYLGENHQVRTPNIDQLAESSMVFLNAYCAAPVCGPSRTSLLYGIYPHKTGSYGHHEVYDPGNISKLANRETLPALFKREGYYTAGAGKIFHYESDGFQTYYDTKNDPEPNPEHPDTYLSSSFKIGPVKPEQEKEIIDFRITEWAIEQLNQDFAVPFFISVGYKKPHLPWIAKESNFDSFNLDSIKLPPYYANDLDDIPNSGKVFARTIFGFNKLEKESDHEFITRQPELWQRLVRAYMASIHHTDEMIGKLMEALNNSQYKDNTIIVLWGDHGWHLGEKDHWRKMTLWRKGTRTPFIVYAPNLTIEGSRYSYPVSLQDIYPTLVDLCGLNTEQELDGISLLPVLENPQTRQDRAVLISHGPGNFAICLDIWRYIQYYNGEEELYNVETDPDEFYNLAGKADYKASLSEFRKYVPKIYEKLLCPRFKSFYDDLD